MAQHPPLPDNRGKTGTGDWPGVGKRKFTILDEVRHFQSNYPEKAFYLQKLKFNDNGAIEYRLGYYIIGKKPKMKGKWAWGQFAPLMPVQDFRAIIRKAKKKGWLKS